MIDGDSPSERALLASAGRRRAALSMAQFSCVYLLQARSEPLRHWVGLTDDLRARLQDHNQGRVPHTSVFRPWRIKSAVAFTDRRRAAAFERYLKTGSGRAFAKRHF